jgi:hypothetical protein
MRLGSRNRLAWSHQAVVAPDAVTQTILSLVSEILHSNCLLYELVETQRASPPSRDSCPILCRDSILSPPESEAQSPMRFYGSLSFDRAYKLQTRPRSNHAGPDLLSRAQAQSRSHVRALFWNCDFGFPLAAIGQFRFRLPLEV